MNGEKGFRVGSTKQKTYNNVKKIKQKIKSRNNVQKITG